MAGRTGHRKLGLFTQAPCLLLRSAAVQVPYPELLSVPLDEAFAEALRRFVAPLARSLSWPELSLIPRERHTSSIPRALLGLAGTLTRGEHPYLAKTAGQDLARAAHATLRGSQAARWFDFLCLNQAVDVRQLAPAWRPDELEPFVEAKVLLRRDGTVMLPVTVVPWGRRWYAAESLHLREHAAAYGTRGAPLDPETDVQIRWFRRTYSGRRFRRFFEAGTGTGVVTLELAELASQREGGEYDARGLAFARVNGALWDRDVRFVYTDVLSGAHGSYDLLHFAPWQPTESTLHLVLAYLDALPMHLAEDGEAVVFVSHQGEADDDAVLTPIADTLARHGLSADQDTLNAYDHGAAGVVAQSFLRIRRQTRARPITPLPTRGRAIHQLRRRLATLR